MLNKKKRYLETLGIALILIFVFITVGIFTYPNNFNTENNESNLNGFKDTGQKCIIDNVQYDVIIDNFSNIVYLMNPSNETLSVIYNKKRQPCTYEEYCARSLL